jgi:Leucine-rich repeat (LRR) protein
MKLLLPMADQITWLDLRYANPKDFSALARLNNLTELHLEHSPIQDADLEHLSGLTKLEYLNLYGTEISNEGIQHLKGLTALRSLYLWQSKVDSTGVKELMTALPETEINLGWPMQTSK